MIHAHVGHVMNFICRNKFSYSCIHCFISLPWIHAFPPVFPYSVDCGPNRLFFKLLKKYPVAVITVIVNNEILITGAILQGVLELKQPWFKRDT